MTKAIPEGFRRDVVAVARKGEASVTLIARDFGLTGSPAPLDEVRRQRERCEARSGL